METETLTSTPATPAPPRLAPPVAPVNPAQHVRVTITGKAHQLAHAPNLLRVEAGGRTVLVDTRDAGVEVETVPAPITWSDGDLVEHTTAGWIGWRESGNWWSTTQAKHNSSGPFCHGDELVERMLRDDELRVVRCQHADRLREQVLS